MDQTNKKYPALISTKVPAEARPAIELAHRIRTSQVQPAAHAVPSGAGV